VEAKFMDPVYETPTGTSSVFGGPTWEIAHLFPTQGHWTEASFLDLPVPHRFELSEGRLEALPMPTWVHALIVQYLSGSLDHFALSRKLGRAAPAPLYVRLWDDQIRQADVVFCFFENIHDRHRIQNGADLAMEVISEGKDNRDRDTVLKRSLYARAGIREYWIVDPFERAISVLTLVNQEYQTAATYKPGEHVASLLLPGFVVDVQALFANAQL
jgi:Uma2 family endonuclease